MIYYIFNEKKSFIKLAKSLEKLKKEIIEEELIELKEDDILNCYTQNNILIENDEYYKKFVQEMTILNIRIEKKKMDDIINKDDNLINKDENIINKKEDDIINENHNQNFSSIENSKNIMIFLNNFEKNKNEISESITEKINTLFNEKINIFIKEFEKKQNEKNIQYNEINQTLKNIENKLNEKQDNNNKINYNQIEKLINNISNQISDIFETIKIMKKSLIEVIQNNYNDIVQKFNELKNNKKGNENINLDKFNQSLKNIESQIDLLMNKKLNNTINEKNFQNIISQIQILKENNIEYNNNNNKQFNNILNVLNTQKNDLKNINTNKNFIPDIKNNKYIDNDKKGNNKNKKIGYKAKLKIINPKVKYKFKDIEEQKEKINIQIINEGKINIPGNCYIKTVNDEYYIPKSLISNTINPNSSFKNKYNILCKNLNKPSPEENIKIILCDGNGNEITSIKHLMNIEFEEQDIQFSKLNDNFLLDKNQIENNNNSVLDITHYSEKINKLRDFFDEKKINQIKEALEKNKGNIDAAINDLLDMNI